VAPSRYACHEAERQAAQSGTARAEWQRCFRTQARWVVTWARAVRAVDLRLGGCVLRRVPVAVREYGDAWWLWWIPLPHVGGPPYRYFDITLELDRGRCAVIDRS
jgi:hypothetical protein